MPNAVDSNLIACAFLALFLVSGCRSDDSKLAVTQLGERVKRIEQATGALRTHSNVRQEAFASLRENEVDVSGDRKEYRVLVQKHFKLSKENTETKAELDRMIEHLQANTEFKGGACRTLRMVLLKLRKRLPDDALTDHEQREYELMMEWLWHCGAAIL